MYVLVWPLASNELKNKLYVYNMFLSFVIYKMNKPEGVLLQWDYLYKAVSTGTKCFIIINVLGRKDNGII